MKYIFPRRLYENRSFRLIIVAFCTILTQWACQPTREILIEPQINTVSVDEAKRQYEAWGRGARGAKKLDKRKPAWESAKSVQFKNGKEGLEIPLLYNWSRQWGDIPTPNGKMSADRLEIQSHLIAYRDGQGAVQFCVVSMFPDKAYQKEGAQRNPNKFTGLLLVQTVDENTIVDAWYCEKGKAITRVPVNTISKNGRRQCPAIEADVWKVVDQITYNAGRQGQQQCGSGGNSQCYSSFDTDGGTVYLQYQGTVTYADPQCSAGNGEGNSDGNSNNGNGYNGYIPPNSGPYGGPSGTGSAVYVPRFTLDDAFVASLGPIDRFFYRAANQHRVIFDDEEQDFIRNSSQIIPALSHYVNDSGAKPYNIADFKWLLDNDYPTTPNREIRANFLKQKLTQDPATLLKFQNPVDLSSWRTLAQKQPPQLAKSRIDQFEHNIGLIYYNSWIQYLNNAAGSEVNCDYFPVKINRLPNGFSSPEQFLEYFRTHINDFSPTAFTPHPSIPGEANRWLNDPLGTIILIDINPDKGSVITIERQVHDWVFATIHDPHPDVANHPVSGNREFGVSYNGDGSFSIYTRGVDRVTSSFDEFVAKITTGSNNTPVQFEEADELWQTMNNRVISFVNQHGGQASSEPGRIVRARWDAVKKYLLGQ